MKTTSHSTSIPRIALCATLAVSVFLAGCETPAESALAGAAVGAGAGYLIGKGVQHDRSRYYDRGYRNYDRGYSRDPYYGRPTYYDRGGYRY